MLRKTVVTVQWYDNVCVWVCVSQSAWTEAGRSLEHSHGNMVLQHAYPLFPNKIWMHKRKKMLSLSPLSGCLQPRTLSQGFAAVFRTWLQYHHVPQSVSVITVECRLLWCRLAAVTGFGMGACRGSMQRLDKLWLGSVWNSVTVLLRLLSDNSRGVIIPFFSQVGVAFLCFATHQGSRVKVSPGAGRDSLSGTRTLHWSRWLLPSLDLNSSWWIEGLSSCCFVPEMTETRIEIVCYCHTSHREINTFR